LTSFGGNVDGRFSDSIKAEGMKHSLICTLSGFGLALALTSVDTLAQVPTQVATQVPGYAPAVSRSRPYHRGGRAFSVGAYQVRAYKRVAKVPMIE
jgi:hypothetical protein